MSLANDIDQILPQLQCRQCGFKGCQPYAQALADNETSIDRCLPGGKRVLRMLADRLNQDPTIYEADMVQREQQSMLAKINHDACIGCRKCIQVCPQDAIAGAEGRNHAVLNVACHGCGLCVPACPMDCVSLVPVKKPVDQGVIAPYHRERHEQVVASRQQKIESLGKAHQVAKKMGSDARMTKKNRLLYMQEARMRLERKHNEPVTT